MDNSTQYDYILAGAGCAGLSLLYHLLTSPTLQHKNILVVDKSFQKSNDRTWCFWETGSGPFEHLVHKYWENISVHNGKENVILPTETFSYKMIQGLDYYNYIIAYAKKYPNVHWREANIISVVQELDRGVVYFESGKLASAPYVFSSILPKHLQGGDTIQHSETDVQMNHNTRPFLWQHFKGIVIEFDIPVFNENIARLMDFNVPQKGATAFMYVLPLTKRKALVEYTLFSENVLTQDEYDQVLVQYIKENILSQHFNAHYSILHEEIGTIPMTHSSFGISSGSVIHIGTLSGAVKASTGYAFQFIQAQSVKIIQQIEGALTINTNMHNSRHRFYDAVLLYILKYRKMEGKEIFTQIFLKNNAPTIFRFLSNTSSLTEDIRIMRSLPTRIFLAAAIRVLLSRII